MAAGSATDSSCSFACALLEVCKRLDSIDSRLERLHFASESEARTKTETRTVPQKFSVRTFATEQSSARSSVLSVATRQELGSWSAPLRRSQLMSASKLHATTPTSPSNNGLVSARRYLLQAVRHPLFDMVMFVVILANSVIIGMDAEGSATNPEHDKVLFENISFCFSCAFIIELLLQIAAEGPVGFFMHLDTWRRFDVLIVLEAVGSAILFCFAANQDVDGLNNVRMVRSLKAMKLLRVLRVGRILQFTVALRELVQGIIVALRLLGWAIVLLTLVIYMFAVFFTSIMDLEEAARFPMLEPYFGSIGDSCMTLVQTIFGGLSWQSATMHLREAGVFYEAAFLVYIAITMLTVLNVVTGGFAAVALKNSESDPELIALNVEMDQKRVQVLAKRLFMFLDVDGSGKVTLLELEEAWQRKEFKALLKALNIDAHDVWLLFNLLDLDADGLIDFGELCEGIHKLTGSGLSLEIARVQLGQKMILKQMEQVSRDRKLRADRAPAVLRAPPAPPACPPADPPEEDTACI